MTLLYVQHDYAVFGFGETRTDAIVVAKQVLADALPGIHPFNSDYPASTFAKRLS